VEYHIEDNGCGMDAETKEKIFRTFFSTKGSKGTGLGLMIAQKIVGEHGGSIEMESEEGSGTRFVVRLPAGNCVDLSSVRHSGESRNPGK
jgi:signal transduction histidine kinase